MKTQITFTRNTAIKEIHRIIGYARNAKRLNCFNVMHDDYDKARFLVSLFFYHQIFDENDYNRFYEEILSEEYDNNEVTF